MTDLLLFDETDLKDKLNGCISLANGLKDSKLRKHENDRYFDALIAELAEIRDHLTDIIPWTE